MSQKRTRGRRTFVPSLDGRRLETRELLSRGGGTPFSLNQFLLTNPQPGFAYRAQRPPLLDGGAHDFRGGPVYTRGAAAVRTIRGGSGVEVAAPDGSHFRVHLQLADSQFDGGLAAQTGGSGNNVIPDTPVQAVGTVRAYPMPGGKVGLIVDGTTDNMQLVIDPLPFPQRRGYAHSFAYGETQREHILNIGSLNVTSGRLNAVLGFHSANLSGPLIIGGGGTVDRIAFNNLLPGASVGVTGTLNTLDVLNKATLTSGPGISIGGDLNLFNVGQDLTLSNGASLLINRFAGLTPQPPKGTGTGSNIIAINQAQIGTGTATSVPGLSAYIKGNVIIGPNSVFRIASGIANSSILGAGLAQPTVFLINGSLNALSASQLQVPNLSVGTGFFATTSGIITGVNNLVARNGVNVPGLPSST